MMMDWQEWNRQQQAYRAFERRFTIMVVLILITLLTGTFYLASRFW
jgi:hypothetical protein